jgi:hypothetical protein
VSNHPLHSGHRPPVREPRPGELLFGFRDGKHRQVDCERVDHGQYGVEAQLWREREFSYSRRFETRALAEQWARLECERIENGGG